MISCVPQIFHSVKVRAPANFPAAEAALLSNALRYGVPVAHSLTHGHSRVVPVDICRLLYARAVERQGAQRWRSCEDTSSHPAICTDETCSFMILLLPWAGCTCMRTMAVCCEVAMFKHI